MGCGREMDSACPTELRFAINIGFLLALLCLWPDSCMCQAPSVESVHQLYEQKQYAEIIRLVPASASNPAELDLYRGLAFAQLQRFSEAKAALEDGERKDPHEERFPAELAGVAYRTNNLDEAQRNLRHALHLEPQDSYALNFLATIYLLRGNLPAALEYWSLTEAPRVSQIEENPQPHVNQMLLQRAITVSPLSKLRLRDFETSDALIGALGIFPNRRWELRPEGSDNYNLVLHSFEEDGWGSNKWNAALSILRGLPYETAYPAYHNMHGSAINFESIVRWDSQKRRVFASVSIPLHMSPKWRLEAYADGRDENWNLTNSFYGAGAPLTALKLRKLEFGAEIRRIENGRWGWQTGGTFSRRTFGKQGAAFGQAGTFFTSGNVLEWNVASDYHLLSIPDRRLTIDSSALGGVGRFFASGGSRRFGRSEGSLSFHWLPQSEGDDYEMNSRFRAGAIIGEVPFDKLYTLGVERDDNDLWLRGISATNDGRKGNSPMGRRYLLWNWDWEKVIYHDAFFELKAGPAIDAGDISDASGAFGSHEWLWDPGAQVSIRVLDTVNVIFSYGRDIRSGQNAFFGTTLP